MSKTRVPQHNEDKDLESLKRALIGIIDDINATLQQAPENLNKILAQAYKFNALVVKFKSLAPMLNINTDKKVNTEQFGEKIKQAFENQIRPLSEASLQNKETLLRTQKGLESIKSEIKNTGRTRGM